MSIAAPSDRPVHPLPAHGAAARLAERWRLWRERRRWIGEMRDAAALGRLEGLLHDIGITHAELDFLIDGPADAGRQFEQLAAAEHVDLSGLAPEVLRDAMWKCIRCSCREPCKRWLESGIWDYEGDPRCPNAALLRQ